MKHTIYTLLTAAVMTASFNAKAQTISTFAGDYTKIHTYSGDGGAATAAGLDGPTTCVFDAAGNLYFSDKYNGSVRMVNPSGIISTYAGSGTPGTSGDGGPATAAKMDWPIGINFDGSGNMYVAAYSSHSIRKIDASGNISTFAGTSGMGGYAGDGGAATNARISYPTDVAADAAGNIYISDWNNGVVRKVNPAGNISTYAGGGSSYTDGCPATDASFYANNSVYVDANNNLFVSDMNDNRLCKISSSALCYTILGTGTAGYSGDGGAATAAKADGPAYIAIDVAGNIFFSDHNNAVIRRIDAATTNVTTVVGSASSGYSGDGGPATAAKLAYPVGICFNKTGDMFFCDQGNSVVRKVTAAPVTLTGTTTLCTGSTTTLTAGTTGGVWSSSNTAVATVSSTGVVTAVSLGTTTINYVMGLAYGTTTFTVNCGPTEINSVNSAANLEVYPNPSNGTFTVSLPTTNNTTTINITDMLGHTVITKTITTSKVSFDEHNLPTGNYIITAVNGEQTFHKKIAITR